MGSSTFFDMHESDYAAGIVCVQDDDEGVEGVHCETFFFLCL